MTEPQNQYVQIPVDVARRIASAVKYVEMVNRGSEHSHPQGGGWDDGEKWAQITDRDETNGQYSWVALEPQDDGSLSQNEDWGKGDMGDDTGFAVEVWGSDCVLKNSIVRLKPAKSADYYVFEYSGGVVKGTLSDHIKTGESGDVDVDIGDPLTSGDDSGGDDSGGDDGSGATDSIKAHNDLDTDIHESDGSTILLAYNIQLKKWVIIAQSCGTNSGSGGGGGGGCGCDIDESCGCDGDTSGGCGCDGDESGGGCGCDGDEGD